MSNERALKQRSGEKCELCAATQGLTEFEVTPSNGSAEKSIYACSTCIEQMNTDDLDANHWRCLNDSMWSQEPAVQVVSYRMLHRLALNESWAQDLIDMM